MRIVSVTALITATMLTTCIAQTQRESLEDLMLPLSKGTKPVKTAPIKISQTIVKLRDYRSEVYDREVKAMEAVANPVYNLQGQDFVTANEKSVASKTRVSPLDTRTTTREIKVELAPVKRRIDVAGTHKKDAKHRGRIEITADAFLANRDVATY